MSSQVVPALQTEHATNRPEPVRSLLGSLRERVSRDTAILGALVLGAAVLRLPTLTRAYWVDEGISVGIAGHRLTQLPRLLHLDGSPPLFYVLLHFWMRAFGSSEVSTHLMALLTSLAVIPIAWWAADQLFGRGAALCAALLSATSPFLAWYGTETRMYPLACALSLLAVALTVRAVRDRELRDVVWASVAFVLLIYTHNWGLYVLVATVVVVALHGLWTRDRVELTCVAGAVAAIGVAYLPWLPSFLAQARTTGAPWAVRPSFGDLFADPASVLGGTLGAAIGPFLSFGVLAFRGAMKTAEANLAALILAVAGVTVLEGWLAAQLDPSWASRYLAVALAPALLGLAGVLGASVGGRRVVQITAVVLAGWSVIGSLLPDANARYAKSNVAAVARAATPLLSPGDLVVVTQTEQLAVTAHYLPAGLAFATPLGAVSDPHVVDWRHLTERLAAADACQTIAPQIAALPTGAHVLVVNPFNRVGASGTQWSYAVNLQVNRINELLFDDPGLRLVSAFSPGVAPKPFSAVVGLLFVKEADTSPCS